MNSTTLTTYEDTLPLTIDGTPLYYYEWAQLRSVVELVAGYYGEDEEQKGPKTFEVSIDDLHSLHTAAGLLFSAFSQALEKVENQ